MTTRRWGSRVNWLLLLNAALGNFLAGTASRIFVVSLPTVASSLETTIGVFWALIAYQISQISLSLIFGRIGDLFLPGWAHGLSGDAVFRAAGKGGTAPAGSLMGYVSRRAARLEICVLYL